MSKVHPAVALVANIFLSRLGVSSPTREASKYPEIAEVHSITKLQHKDGAVVLILGRRESGKTVLAQRIAEVIGRPTYCVSPEQAPPHWIKELQLEQLAEQPPPYSTVILDDLPVYASQHSYTDPYVRILEQLIPVVRHRRKLILVFCSQSSSLSDRYVMDADAIFLKSPNILFSDMERPSVVKLYKRALPAFSKMSEMQLKRHAYLVSQDEEMLVRVERSVK